MARTSPYHPSTRPTAFLGIALLSKPCAHRDEIDALPLLLQGKLLIAIEEKRVRRVGAVVAQALLDSLVESLPASRILLLVSYRPDYHHSWTSRTYYSQLRLDPLSAESARELAHAILGHDASVVPLSQGLIELTEGNPLFLEEGIQTLVETQALAGERGAYRLAKALQHLQVPATVLMVLAARIDRLPIEGKRLLQIAAVIGQDVPFSLLQAIVELPAEALRRGLTHLQRAEFLYERSLFPGLAYTFKHALTHEVAYESLRQGQRRALHARIIGAIEALDDPRRLGRVLTRLSQQFSMRGAHDQAGAAAKRALTLATAGGDVVLQALANR